MATLTDRYVQTLVKYNDALTAQRQKDVQKQYDNWAKRNTQPQKTDIIEPVRGMSPATGDQEIEETPADVAKIDTIADAAKKNNFNLTDVGKYLSATGVKKATNFLSDLISPAISTIKRQTVDTLEKAKTNATNNADRVAEVQPRNNALANDYADIQAFAEANKNKYKSQPSRESGVVMDEYGNVDIESVKRDARERAKELANIQQNATNDIPVLQPTKHSSTTSLNSPALQLAQDQTKAGEDINQRIAKRAEEWLAPDYKMTFKDAREFRALLDEWAGGDDNKYRQLGLYQMFPIGGSDTEKNLTAISKKLSYGMSAVTGVNDSLGGIINFAGMLGKLAGEATGNEAIIEEINKELAQRDTDIANAQRQHPVATGAGYFAGTAAQYAATNGLLGAFSGGKLAGESVYKAGKAASNLAKAKGASTLGRAWETAKAAVPTFGTNVAKQMIPDLVVDTLPNIFDNAVDGADAKTIAVDALRNVRDNAILNSLMELGGVAVGAGMNTKTGRKVLESLGINVDEPVNKTVDNIVEQTQKDAIESPIDRTKYTRDDYIRELAGENSYALNPEYKENVARISDLLEQEDNIGKEISALRKELENEINIDPELGKEYSWMFDDNYTERGLELKNKIEQKEAERKALANSREEIENIIRNVDAENRAIQASSFKYDAPSPATKTSYDGFSVTTTGNRDIDKMLADGKAYIAEMSPEEYLRRSSQEVFEKGTFETALNGISDANVQKYADEMRNGAKYDMPYLDLARREQEGRHRALAAYVNGYDSIPVAIVPKSTDEIATGAKNLAEQIDNEARLTVQPQRTNTVQTTDVEIPEGMKERSYARNIRQGNVPTDETTQDVFATTPRTYTPVSNAQTRADVDAIMAEGTEYAQKVFDGIKGASDARFAPLGHDLAQEYAKAGRYADAVRVLDEVSEQLTKAGQMNQAAIITMVKDDPITALSYLQRQINKLNVEGQKKFGNKWNDITLTDNEIKAMQSIKPGDEESIKFMWDYVGDRIAKEYPTTMMEKLLEARKVAMLLNSRTLIRNFGANVPTLGMRWLSDRFSAVGERAYHLINPDYKLTQSLLGSGKQSKNISRDIWNSDYVKGLREGSSGKYEIPELNGTIFKRKTVYKGTAFDKLLESAGLNFEAINKKLFGRSNVHSAAETTRNLTYKLLDIGDTPFVKKNFMDRLGSYIQANGIKNVADVPQEAIDIAWQEALKATYKDNSWAVKAVSGFRNAMRKIPGVGEPLAQATIPFVQAPGNIAARMVDYSPIGGTTGAVRLINQIAKGAKNADVNVVRESIDQLAKGMTGTSLVALGIALYNSGLITGSYSSDKDQRQFQKQSGYREYALHIGDKYYTYDWAQPFAENLLIGTILADAIKRSDEYDSDMLKYYGIEDSGIGRFTGALKQGVKESVNSWFNESPLQGLADLMKGDNRSYDTDIAGNIWDTAVVDFASSFIPASVNAMAKTSDSTQRQTRDYTNEWASFLNAQKAKIPGLSDDLPAKYDTWGREMKYGETLADAAFNRFINPGDTGTDKHDPLDDEINRLFNETKDERVFPQVAPTTADGEKLTAEQYAEYQKNMGERSHEMVEDLIKSDFYKSMSDEEKADMLAKIYTASKALTEKELYGKDYSNKMADLYAEGKMEKVISYFNTQKVMEDNGIGTGSDKVNEYIEGAKDPEKAAKEIVNVTKLAKQYGMVDKDADKPSADVLEKYEALGYDGLKDYGEMLTKARKSGMITETSNSVPDAMQEFYDEYGMKGVDDYVDTMDTLRKNGLVDENSKTVPKDVREIYAQSGMRGVNDYVTIETNEKGASYSGYQKMQEQIPTLTAKEYNKIFDTYSVPSENGNYNGTFSKDAELIPYLTSRAWSNDQELNIYAHALSPSVEGTWHIKNNQLYYNKPSVERWNG